MNKSEVALLREQIELDCIAGWRALHELALGSAQHEFITARMRHMDACHQNLSKLIGEEQATTVVCDIFNEVGERFASDSQASTRSEAGESERLLTPKSVLHKITLTQEDM